jgi:hypothetical protein
MNRRDPKVPNDGSKTNAVLNFIREQLDAGKPFPRPQDISKFMGWSSVSSGRDVLLRLIIRGYVLRIPATEEDPGYPIIKNVYLLTEKGRQTAPYVSMRAS